MHRAFVGGDVTAAWLHCLQVNLFRETVVFFNYDDLIARCPFEDFASALTEEPDCILAAMGVALCVVRAVHCIRRTTVWSLSCRLGARYPGAQHTVWLLCLCLCLCVLVSGAPRCTRCWPQ